MRTKKTEWTLVQGGRTYVTSSAEERSNLLAKGWKLKTDRAPVATKMREPKTDETK